MRKLALLAAAALAATAIPSAAYADNCSGVDGLSGSLTIPDPAAVACVGYFTNNLLNSSNQSAQQSAINTLLSNNGLPQNITVNWAALDGNANQSLVLTSDPSDTHPGLTGPDGDQLNFGTTLSGYTVVGAHWGNVPDDYVNPDGTGRAGNVTVFWLFNFVTPTDHITLTDTGGWSNAALYSTSNTPGVPEPTTWAMMLLGFGATGFAMRRTRSKALLPQLA